MVTNIFISDDYKQVQWQFMGENKILNFSSPIFQAINIKELSVIVIVEDYRKVGPNNLFIFNANGSLNSNPNIYQHFLEEAEVLGVYSMWYNEGNENQTIVLIPKRRSDYELKSLFNIKSGTFSNLTLTK